MRQDEIWDADAACSASTSSPTTSGSMRAGGGGCSAARTRYIWPAELDLMAQLAGFELEARHADWHGAEFTAESRSHVSVYRLPGVTSG
jgi:hypothetical protein